MNYVRGKRFVAFICMIVMLMFAAPMFSFAEERRGDNKNEQKYEKKQQKKYYQQRWKNDNERRGWYNSGYWVIDRNGNRIFVKRDGHKYYR
jgi:hypothetical protein